MMTSLSSEGSPSEEEEVSSASICMRAARRSLEVWVCDAVRERRMGECLVMRARWTERVGVVDLDLEE
jgi:hypothetical protein